MPRLVRRRRQEEREGEVGLPEAPGGVDARREAEGDVLAGERRADEVRDLGERARAGAVPLATSRARPARTSARLSPSSGATSAIVPRATKSSQARRSSATPSSARTRGADAEREADRGEPLVGEAAVGAVRVQERERGERLVGDAVVVDDDDVDAAAARVLEARVVARAAVARDEERRAGGEDALERGRGEAVAPLEAIGEERDDAAAERAEHVGHERGAGDAVGVVVAEDGDRLAGADGAGEARGGLGAVLHQRGRREVRERGLEEAGGALLVGEAALHEHVGRGLGDAEVAREVAAAGVAGEATS